VMEVDGRFQERDAEEILRLPLPKGWLRTTVGQIGEVRLGRQRSPKNRSSLHPTRYLRAANITWEGLALSDVLDMEFRPEELNVYRLQPGDVLLSEASGSASEVGKPALWNGEIQDCCFQNTVIRFRSNIVLPRFALHVFSHFARNGLFSRVSKGVGIHHLSADRFSALPFLVPPHAEQHRIVAKIEELFSDLDAGVAALTRVQANLKRYRAAVLKAAVEGKLTEDWRAQHPDTEPASVLLNRILTERRRQWEQAQLSRFAQAGRQPPKGWREKYQEPSLSETRRERKLPVGWCFASVEQISHFAKYGSSAKTSNQAGGVPVIRMGNIQDGRLDLSDLKYLPAGHEEFPDLLLEEGDLLFNRTNSAELVGKTAVYEGAPSPCSFASYLIAVRAVRGCNPKLLCYYLNSILGRAWIASVVSQQVGQANVNGTKLQALAFPLPTEGEQAAIIQELEFRLSIIDGIDAQVKANLNRAARLRQGILKRAFEGRLVPLDPSDESVKDLLAGLPVSKKREEASWSDSPFEQD
jgi:type I restriction enzyme, S subunit